MCHPLLSPSCMATIVLCLWWASSSCANGTGLGGPALGGLATATCPQLPLTEGTMAGCPAPGRAHTASLALGPQRRSSALPARPGGHKLTSSPGFGDVAPGNGETKGGPMIFITEMIMGLWRKTCQAEQGTGVLLECKNDAVWSFSHHTSRCLSHTPGLMYYSLILPLCVVTSILVTVTGIQLLARYMRSYQRQRQNKQQSKEQWLGSPPGMVWGAANYLDCAICLRAYRPGERLKVLSCSHAYHGKCIDLWHRAQRGSRTCPLCLHSVTMVVLIPFGAHSDGQE